MSQSQDIAALGNLFSTLFGALSQTPSQTRPEIGIVINGTTINLSSIADSLNNLSLNGITMDNTEFIKNFKTLVVKEYKPPQSECSICQSEYQQGDTVMIFPCENVFHEKCLIPWLKIHSTCPICRKDVIQLRKDEMNKEKLLVDTQQQLVSNLTPQYPIPSVVFWENTTDVVEHKEAVPHTDEVD